MIKRIVCYFVSGLIIIAGIYGYIEYQSLVDRITFLELDNQRLNNTIDVLSSEKDNYDGIVDAKNDEINELKVINDELAIENEKLMTDNEHIEAERIELSDKVLNSFLYYENPMNLIPSGYYTNSEKSKTIDDLATFMNNTFSMPVGYNLNVFDCSEQAAFLERELENAGFTTSIMVGDSPFSDEGKHAWVMVYTSDNYRAAIEPTVIFGATDSYFDVGIGNVR